MTEPVEVTSRLGTFPGVRLGRVARYEFEGTPLFLLLDDHVQLHQPPGFTGVYAGWWYVDLVELTEDETTITVVDHWVDVVVPPWGDPFQVRDLDELGEAIAAGAITAEQAAIGLTRVQRFLDTHLRGELRAELQDDWADFPPKAIEPLR